MKVTSIRIEGNGFVVESNCKGLIKVHQCILMHSDKEEIQNSFHSTSDILDRLEQLVSAIKVAIDVSQGEPIEVKNV